ncbi:MAG: ATP-binding protein [Luteolibacter sp.]
MHAHFVRFAGFSGGFAILLGLLVLTGWVADIDQLKRGLPGLNSMNPMTAVCFVLAGISLVLQYRPDTRRSRRVGIARFLGGIVAVIGLLVLMRYVLGWSFKLDQVLFATKLSAAVPEPPNRMALNSSLCCALLGVGLFLGDFTTQRGARPAEYFAVACWLLSLVALAGYVYQVEFLYGLVRHVPMALHTALGYHLLSMGLLFARPGQGLMRTIAGDSPGGVLMRRLFPVMIPIFIVLGCLQVEGARRDFFQAAPGVALFTVASVAISGLLILWCARFLHQADLDRKRVERELDRFFTLSMDLLAIGGMDGYFKRVNPAFCRLLGFSAEELAERPFADFVHPDDVAATANEVAKLSSGLSSINFENRCRCKDGSWKWLSWSTQPSDDNLLYAVARDVTEQKKTEVAILRLNADLLQQTAQLQSVNHELESFSYSVSHDLRAPLRGISGFVQALEEHARETLDDTGRGYIGRVRQAADRMGELIDDLLKLSRLTRAKMSMETVDLSEIAESLLAGYRTEDPARKVETVVQPDIRVLGDPALLRVLLDNLLGNAWKFTGKNVAARIEVGSTTADHGEIICHVRDNGVGFDARYGHKLFGAFQRLHSQGEFPGTGIGLATVQRIVSRHGGEVRAEGAINHGATFSFVLGTVPSDEKQDHTAGGGQSR